MKKLLLLGGSRFLLPVIKSAHKLDCHVITCDYLPNNIAHKFSDEYINASIIEKDVILNVAQKNNIDAIMSFACDPGVVTAAYVAEKMNLPSCGSFESVSILQNKGRFRKFLFDNGFNVPFARNYYNKVDAFKEIDRFVFPVIVKPVDSAGSKGVTRVGSKDQLSSAVDTAIENSISSEFIIEEYLTADGHPSDSECFSVNGQLSFVSYSSQFFDIQCINPFTPSGFTWEPSISENGRKELTNELQRLLFLLKMGTSLYNVETRECQNGKSYIMEVSPRGGGNRLAEMIRYSYGVDLIDNAVKAALGLEISSFEGKKNQNEFWAEVILHGQSEGILKRITYTQTIEPYIYEEDIWIKKGDHIDEFTGANKTIGTMIMRFDNIDYMETFMNDPYKYINIEVE